MKINTEELAEKIVSLIKNDLAALFSLGSVEPILKSSYGKSIMDNWIPIIDGFIQDAIKKE